MASQISLALEDVLRLFQRQQVEREWNEEDSGGMVAMTPENFERLKESIIEAGQVARGERAAERKSVHEIQMPREKAITSLAVCVQTDDPELLVPRKIYEITLYENDLARVIDEAGEATIYPASFFMAISLPEAVENTLAKIA